MCKTVVKMNVINVSSQWSEKADFMVDGVTLLSRQGLRYPSSWVREYQRLPETKSRFRETGNNGDKESLLMRGTDLLNENHTYVSY